MHQILNAHIWAQCTWLPWLRLVQSELNIIKRVDYINLQYSRLFHVEHNAQFKHRSCCRKFPKKYNPERTANDQGEKIKKKDLIEENLGC